MNSKNLYILLFVNWALAGCGAFNDARDWTKSIRVSLGISNPEEAANCAQLSDLNKKEDYFDFLDCNHSKLLSSLEKVQGQAKNQLSDKEIEALLRDVIFKQNSEKSFPLNEIQALLKLKVFFVGGNEQSVSKKEITELFELFKKISLSRIENRFYREYRDGPEIPYVFYDLRGIAADLLSQVQSVPRNDSGFSILYLVDFVSMLSVSKKIAPLAAEKWGIDEKKLNLGLEFLLTFFRNPHQPSGFSTEHIARFTEFLLDSFKFTDRHYELEEWLEENAETSSHDELAKPYKELLEMEKIHTQKFLCVLDIECKPVFYRSKIENLFLVVKKELSLNQNSEWLDPLFEFKTHFLGGSKENVSTQDIEILFRRVSILFHDYLMDPISRLAPDAQLKVLELHSDYASFKELVNSGALNAGPSRFNDFGVNSMVWFTSRAFIVAFDGNGNGFVDFGNKNEVQNLQMFVEKVINSIEGLKGVAKAISDPEKKPKAEIEKTDQFKKEFFKKKEFLSLFELIAESILPGAKVDRLLSTSELAVTINSLQRYFNFEDYFEYSRKFSSINSDLNLDNEKLNDRQKRFFHQVNSLQYLVMALSNSFYFSFGVFFDRTLIVLSLTRDPELLEIFGLKYMEDPDYIDEHILLDLERWGPFIRTLAELELFDGVTSQRERIFVFLSLEFYFFLVEQDSKEKLFSKTTIEAKLDGRFSILDGLFEDPKIRLALKLAGFKNRTQIVSALLWSAEEVDSFISEAIIEKSSLKSFKNSKRLILLLGGGLKNDEDLSSPQLASRMLSLANIIKKILQNRETLLGPSLNKQR